MIDYKNLSQPKIIVLDNDECLGQFSIFSILLNYSMNKDSIKINLNKLKQSCIQYLFGKGSIRPNIKILFKLLYKLKKLKKIDKVVMYTSAPNNSKYLNNYVLFLKNLLEEYCQTPGLYDFVFHRNNIKANITKDGATIKDLGNVILNNKERDILYKINNKSYGILNYKEKDFLKYVNHKTKNIIMIDDKPHNIEKRGGKVIGVFPYIIIPNLNDIYSCIDNIPNLKEKLIKMGHYYYICQEFYKEYKNQYKFVNSSNINKINNDTQLLKVSLIIKKLFS